MMGEEFYCVLKLISGEEIFSLVSIDENNEDPIVILQNPVVMKISYTEVGSIVKIKPWMEIPDDDFYMIKLDKIITMTEITNKSTIGIYNKYLDNEFNLNGEVKITDKMGYISSVENARKKLEDLYKDIKES
jgi:hypothetical protein